MSQQIWQQNPVAIVGVGATPQAAHVGVSAYQLSVASLKLAMQDAGIEHKNQIHGVLTSRQLGGIDPIELSRTLGMNPRVTGDLDYSTGGFTTQYAAMLIATGFCDVVACVYGRNVENSFGKLCGVATYDLDTGFVNANAVFAMGWQRHMQKYGTNEKALGHIAIAAHKHAALNPLAAWPQPLTMDDYLADEFAVWPLRNYDIARITAGAVTIILARGDMAKDMAKKPVYLQSVGRQQAARMYENDEHLLCWGMKDCAKQAYTNIGLQPQDIDVLCISDACTAAVMHTLENYGFCGEGESGDFVKDGAIELGGAIPVNPHGGQIGEGYLVGWLHHVELVRQLRGEAGPRQIANASVAQYCATGRQRLDFLTSIYSTH